MTLKDFNEDIENIKEFSHAIINGIIELNQMIAEKVDDAPEPHPVHKYAEKLSHQISNKLTGLLNNYTKKCLYKGYRPDIATIHQEMEPFDKKINIDWTSEVLKNE